MPNQEVSITYFEKPGRQNTEVTLKLAKKRAEHLGIQNIIIASSTGATGVLASELFQKQRCIVVGSVYGFRYANESRFHPEYRKRIENNGGTVFHAAHAFGTLGRAVHQQFNTIQVDEIIAHVLRRFGQGVKVVCEIACMAVDAGLIRTDEEVIGIGGSGGGADTALVVQPSNTHRFFEMIVKEIICKPRL
jgi:hypothetical protein